MLFKYMWSTVFNTPRCNLFSNKHHHEKCYQQFCLIGMGNESRQFEVTENCVEKICAYDHDTDKEVKIGGKMRGL